MPEGRLESLVQLPSNSLGPSGSDAKERKAFGVGDLWGRCGRKWGVCGRRFACRASKHAHRSWCWELERLGALGECGSSPDYGQGRPR